MEVGKEIVLTLVVDFQSKANNLIEVGFVVVVAVEEKIVDIVGLMVAKDMLDKRLECNFVFVQREEERVSKVMEFRLLRIVMTNPMCQTYWHTGRVKVAEVEAMAVKYTLMEVTGQYMNMVAKEEEEVDLKGSTTHL